MVVQRRYFVYIIMALLGLLWLGEKIYIERVVAQKEQELQQKSQQQQKLQSLEALWSKQHQKSELKRLQEFLDAFDISYKLTQQRKSKKIAMKLPYENAQKVIGFVMGLSLNIKSFTIKRVDAQLIEFSVVIG